MSWNRVQRSQSRGQVTVDTCTNISFKNFYEKQIRKMSVSHDCGQKIDAVSSLPQ
jgi:hypothetical protein